MLHSIRKNKQGSTALLMTMLILFAIFTVTLAVSDVILNNLKVGRGQADSTKAFFAAEAGAERILYEIRKRGIYPGEGDADDFCNAPQAKFCFIPNNGPLDSCTAGCSLSGIPSTVATTTLSNGAEYYILFKYVEVAGNSTTTLSSYGQYKEMRRKVDLMF